MAYLVMCDKFEPTKRRTNANEINRLSIRQIWWAVQKTENQCEMNPKNDLKEQRKKQGTFTIPDLSLRGAPWGIRTLDLLIRSQTLYPAELKAQTLFLGSRVIVAPDLMECKREFRCNRALRAALAPIARQTEDRGR